MSAEETKDIIGPLINQIEIIKENIIQIENDLDYLTKKTHTQVENIHDFAKVMADNDSILEQAVEILNINQSYLQKEVRELKKSLKPDFSIAPTIKSLDTSFESSQSKEKGKILNDSMRQSLQSIL